MTGRLLVGIASGLVILGLGIMCGWWVWMGVEIWLAQR